MRAVVKARKCACANLHHIAVLLSATVKTLEIQTGLQESNEKISNPSQGCVIMQLLFLFTARAASQHKIMSQVVEVISVGVKASDAKSIAQDFGIQTR